MKNKTRYFSLAVIALTIVTLTGCEKETAVDTLTYTATVQMEGSGTKALDANGIKTFAVGDRIAVIYKNTSGETVKAVSDALTTDNILYNSKAATFSVELTNPDKSQPVSYVYPASIVNSEGTMTSISYQNGTLASLASNRDYCRFDAANWGGDNLPVGILSNQLAILKLTVKKKSDNSDITSSVECIWIEDGSHTYVVNRQPAGGPIYVAMVPVSNANITIEAFIVNNSGNTLNYIVSASNKTFEAGTLYPITTKMHLNLADNDVAAFNSCPETNPTLNLTQDFLSGNPTITITRADGIIEMNGHSVYRLQLQNNVSGKTLTLRNGTVTGEIDGNGGFDDCYYGTVKLDNMNVAQIWTDGHLYEIYGGTYGNIDNFTKDGYPGKVRIYDYYSGSWNNPVLCPESYFTSFQSHASWIPSPWHAGTWYYGGGNFKFDPTNNLDFTISWYSTSGFGRPGQSHGYGWVLFYYENREYKWCVDRVDNT